MSERVGRSFRAKYLLASELAFWNNPKDSWTAITGSGVAGMSITAESTPNPGPEGALFESLLDNPQWTSMTVDYHANPAHTPEWKEGKLAELDGDTARFGQEYECSLDKASMSQSVIPLQAIRDAMTRDEPEGLPVVIGVDVARFGDDRSVITVAKGRRVLPQIILRGMDTQTLAKRVYDTALLHRAETVNVDVIGVGGGVVDALNMLGLPNVNGVNVAEPAWNNDKYANLKAELWFSLRQRMLDGEVSIPDDKDLERELMCSYKYNLVGKIVIQAKDEVKKVLGRSPDLADSLVLAFAPRMGLVA
jgi:phage terminase large subunit